MKFSYTLFADAANTSSDGKLNILGAGIRVVTVPKLPGLISGTLVATLDASPEEAGPYRVVISLIDPHGTERVVVDAESVFDPTGHDPRVPTGIGLTVQVVQPVIDAGLYRIRSRVGDAETEYAIVVVDASYGSGNPAPPKVRKVRAAPIKKASRT